MKLFFGFAAVMAQSLIVAGFGIPRIETSGDETSFVVGSNPKLQIEFEEGERPELEFEFE